MKAAFVIWSGRIAPVFDVARDVHIVDADSGRIAGEADESLPDEAPAKAVRLAELGVEDLVCGAISHLDRALVEAYGIRVIPFVAGDLTRVIRAWMARDLGDGSFAMPGCCGRRHRGVGGRFGSRQEDRHMRGGFRGGANPGGGPAGGGGPGGGGWWGQGHGCRGGSGSGPSGFCVCPRCGHREPHQRGTPCVGRRCPSCGTGLVRE